MQILVPLSLEPPALTKTPVDKEGSAEPKSINLIYHMETLKGRVSRSPQHMLKQEKCQNSAHSLMISGQ